MAREDGLWFYVRDYPAVKEHLERAYEFFDVLEWSAEPGRTRYPNDADVTVRGDTSNLLRFMAWLKADGLLVAGVRVEGRRVT